MTGYEGEGLYTSLMRVWNPALSLRTTACPVEDSSPRWSNSHALTRDPGGGRHSARNALVLVHETWWRRRPREHLSWSPDPLRLHRDTVLPPRSQDPRDHRDPIATAGACVYVCSMYPGRIDGGGSIIGTRRGSRVCDWNFGIAARPMSMPSIRCVATSCGCKLVLSGTR